MSPGVQGAGEEPGRPEGQGRPIQRGAVIGGAILGFLGTWLIFAVVYMALWNVYGDSASTAQFVIGLAALLALPVAALAFMISPRSRHAGAGLLMGIAIGSVLGAGVCATSLG